MGYLFNTLQLDDGVNSFMDMLLMCTPAHRDELLAAVTEVDNAGNEEIEVSAGNGCTLTVNVEAFKEMLETMSNIDDGHAQDMLDLMRPFSTVSEDEEFMFFGGGYDEIVIATGVAPRVLIEHPEVAVAEVVGEDEDDVRARRLRRA